MVRSYGFLSTHPPTHCGLATFNSSLVSHLGDVRTGVVRIVSDADDLRPGPAVVHTWPMRAANGWREAADALSAFDVAVVQHEYGIFPGVDGRDVVPLLLRLTVPSIVVLHTVLAKPTPGQKLVLERVVAAADAIVTMTGTARDRLVNGYVVDPGKVTVIPHGAPVFADSGQPAPRQPNHLLTWGLLGPGKGIEWALRSLASLRDLDPAPTYTVAGRTHPKVLELHGDAYRAGLYQLGAQLGVSSLVRYESAYHDADALARLIRSADVVVLPYDSVEQVTSGVLVEAVTAGVPVVATRFPHAVELLTRGPGLLVPHRDPKALAAAIRRILTEPGLAATLTGARRRTSQPVLWPAVAQRYAALADGLVERRGLVPVAAIAAA
ncbi:glycosyltransferase involved in cell wall biosynthesis [Asanoa ferruginea]|uniref:Glycosyltransferase involved in cell wall biosynthesis n=1 Tax=Asanoa ferruginea TaxID=53367 RepID=A0A3D9ZRH1_9ACTN|nr:glycosyltransferase [Asanoa ferruginea]REF99998.1 glycosyltransferase involved in cell wall biosynthesis [Asanoa ferruginea]GIF51737.1 glycosyl transferase family 1 [Asanoa ferruginea]